MRPFMHFKVTFQRIYEGNAPKICEICGAKSGYMCNMEACAGTQPTEPDHNSFFSVVNRLCDHIKNKGYRVYMDWWFTCPHTLDHLRTLRTKALHTVVAERKKIKETEESLKTLCKKRCKRSFHTCMMTGWLMCWNQEESTKNKPVAVIDYNKHEISVDSPTRSWYVIIFKESW
jgi:hypothetical protein